ncbi:class I SAM-dependent DNA methyltransferase [Lacticaseibacillus chiayiensis]|uniref:class I SAM-dependent DNA methyltransferase n=1 Tax=Lacticaseibacillus chiayiensis TaxID=2100821 RepID=UPI003C75291B
MIYTTFAEVYDQLMDQSLYLRWRDYVKKRVVPNHQPLLELAGGSGFLAVMLAEAGYQVTNFDLSADMLTLAKEKAVDAGVELNLIQGDMRDLQDLPTFPVVTCFDDSICYMPDLGAVRQVFAQVAALLPSGGDFLFDAHSLYQMDQVFPGYMYNYQSDDFAFLWNSFVGEKPHSIEHDLTFFIYDEGLDAYKPLTETHKERTYPLEDYLAALQATGFEKIEVTADFCMQPVSAKSTRWFFHAKKR